VHDFGAHGGDPVGVGDRAGRVVQGLGRKAQVQRLGADLANRVARRLVVAPHRQGGQAQYSEQPVQRDSEGDRLSATLAWVSSHLAERHGGGLAD
jgi:hypothetical protein